MVILEGIALTAKPIVVAGVTTYVLDRSGFENPFSQIYPMVGLWSHSSKEGVDDSLALSARQYFCHFFSKQRRNTRDSVEEEAPPQYIQTTMRIMGAWDVLMGGVLLSSMYMPIDQPLRLWLGGSLLLGFPTSALVYNVAKKVSFKHAFLVESAATAASFGWLSYGILIVSKSEAWRTAPILLWTVYGSSVTSWTVVGTSLLGLILTTVVAMSFGGKPTLGN